MGRITNIVCTVVRSLRRHKNPSCIKTVALCSLTRNFSPIVYVVNILLTLAIECTESLSVGGHLKIMSIGHH